MMMRSALALMATLATASAFAPVSRPAGASLTSCQAAAMDDMIGSVDFRGKEFKFDPLKLSETYSPFLPWFRETELRHGRTAMLAVVGFIATDFVRIPGELYSFETIPKTIDAHDFLLDKGPMGQLVLWIGLWDLLVTAPACVAAAKGEREPGGTYLCIVLMIFLESDSLLLIVPPKAFVSHTHSPLYSTIQTLPWASNTQARTMLP
jgi:hypothetical protein